MSVLLSFYRGTSSLAIPLLRRHLRARVARGKEDASRLREREGYASCARPGGRLVWIHAASVGEALSALPLIAALRVEHPEIAVLMTTGTTTSAALIAKRAPELTHQFVPIDVPSAVGRFLDHWRPDLALWMESELWPTLVLETRRRGIPSALVNGRISAKSARNWGFVRRSARALLSAFDLRLLQTDTIQDRVLSLGAPTVGTHVTGDLKASRPIERPAPAALAALQQSVGSRPVWLAASTHPGEEEVVAQAHQAMAARAPDLLTIIAPRHPERGAEIAQMLKERGLNAACRTENPELPDASVYIADTLGEMPLWYALAPIAYVGAGWGTLGGHNPLEPAQVGVAVLSGPNVANFADSYAHLRASGAAKFVDDTDALTQALLDLTDSDGHPNDIARKMGEAGAEAAAPDKTPLDLTMSHLRPLIERVLT